MFWIIISALGGLLGGLLIGLYVGIVSTIDRIIERIKRNLRTKGYSEEAAKQILEVLLYEVK